MKKTPPVDRFANIAQMQAQARSQSLETPAPPDLLDWILPFAETGGMQEFPSVEKIETAAQLKSELRHYRKRFALFQQKLAPDLPVTRIRLAIEQFAYRLQTGEDCREPLLPLAGGGEWESVSIPHYGGPLGRARAYYRATFEVTPEMIGLGCLFVHFQGVDYLAHVFVNGAYLGSHEGFFAPFEFEFTAFARAGENSLLVLVENDAICMGNDSWGEDGHLYEGDKIYAATGPGWDDPLVGWHHCPPGMGIYQPVWVEARADLHIRDVFVRPVVEEKRAEAWIEVYNSLKTRQNARLELAVFGQNFELVVQREIVYRPGLPTGPGVNDYRVNFEIPRMRLWEPGSPWLYQLQVRLLDANGNLLDARSSTFGMRSFRMDEAGDLKGRLLLNGQPVRLRGANTMGFEQQDVMKQDWDQLRDDILLAKICHMNFWRLTQRPVQAEVYTLCDELGLMTQTDQPLFAVLRRHQFVEAVRQAGEMERLVRSHPCNIMDTYINEPFPDADSPFTTAVNATRHLTRLELESFFLAADQAVRLANPDRVIKPVDGDYYPPAPGLPDNHCYCGWYNGHGVELGRLHRGYWQAVKPGWFYGCGEFGSEGLDPDDLMRRRYPAGWLPQTPQEEAAWSPNQIVKAQTGQFHYMWFDTQHSVDDWVHASQQHQAWITRLMTEAFRRDRRMVSCAIHLFIDAFPAGWMKAIMDTERQPKPAYFAYREALTPLMVNLRTDRYHFFAGESIRLEAWICNDLPQSLKDARLVYQARIPGGVSMTGMSPARVPAGEPAFQGWIEFLAPVVAQRTSLKVRLGLLDGLGKPVHDTEIDLQVFPRQDDLHNEDEPTVYCLGKPDGPAAQLAAELGLAARPFNDESSRVSLVLVDDYEQYHRLEARLLKRLQPGAKIAFLELPPGEYEIAGSRVDVKACGMSPVHFVSRASGHPLVGEFAADDFRFWFDPQAGCVTPLLETTFTAEGWLPVLSTGNGG